MSNPIQTAELTWQHIDGIDIPISTQFGDSYFCKDNGLLETRHVFLNGNDLSQRLSQLQPFQYFCVGETGFGTGLNILALWQLWQQVRPDNNAHLHVTTVEKFPLTKTDLIRALNAWPELKAFSEQLIAQYPDPIAGCHRLRFNDSRFSVDLWFGDALDVFPSIEKTTAVNAWFLDGFSPSCNPELWQEDVLAEVVRLSAIGTTFSSFSVAGVLKRGLKQYGISISRPRGYRHKKEMLKAIWQANETETVTEIASQPTVELKQREIAVIGAGIAGLTTAWAFASRGHKVRIYDQTAPLSGGSGNPLALLNPKLCPIEQTAQHLMTLAWQHALQHYAKFSAFRPIAVQQIALKNADDLLQLAEQYPAGILQAGTAQDRQLVTEYPSLNLCKAGAVSPQQLRDEILQHPWVEYQQAHIDDIQQFERVHIFSKDECLGEFDHAIVCSARNSAAFFSDYPILKPIRGQVSWLNNADHALDTHQAYSYGGYCMQLNTDQLIMGASFYPNRDDRDVLLEDHQHNLALMAGIFPDYANTLPPVETWQGRASVRAQSLDYFPVLGKMQQDQEIYSFAGLGSKGFLFAPLCSELLAAQILAEACPIPSNLVKKLSATRFQKKLKAKKPYFKNPTS